jgi:transcriptional regulator with XRE-family HTH domain
VRWTTLAIVTASFRSRLEHLAAAAGLSPSAAGIAAGVSKGTVNQWIRKEAASGNISALLRLVDHYKVSLDWVTGRSDEGGPRGTGAPVPDPLALAREAATAISFELGIPIAEAWRGAFDARVESGSTLEEYKRAIRAALREIEMTQQLSGSSPSSPTSSSPPGPGMKGAGRGFRRKAQELSQGPNGAGKRGARE